MMCLKNQMEKAWLQQGQVAYDEPMLISATEKQVRVTLRDKTFFKMNVLFTSLKTLIKLNA